MLRARHSVQSLLAVVAVGFTVGSAAVPRPRRVLAGVPSLPNLHHSTRIDSDRPECRHNWDSIPMPRDGDQRRAATATLVFPAGLAVSGPQSNVPEFNDCQRMIQVSADGRMDYGPLMAVFAQYRRDTVSIARDSLSSNTNLLAAAEVLAYSNVAGYDTLGVAPMFNCLYVWGVVGNLKAKMVSVGTAEADCAKIYQPSNVPGKPLFVHEARLAGFSEKDRPRVARWDWDDSSKIQYIGLQCGKEWCEVGPARSAAPTTAAFAWSQPYANSAAATVHEARVGRVKGWYDEQYLSMFDAAGLHPTLLRGTLIPDPELETIAPEDNPGLWYATSHVALHRPPAGTLTRELAYYRDKFNFDPVGPHAPIGRMNHILICYGLRAQCGLPAVPTSSLRSSCAHDVIAGWASAKGYWSQITSPVRPPMYRCVTYYWHSGVSIPATARWRWLATDETTWRYCPSGCCEVNGNF